LTLNAPTPYPPFAASSRSCRIETRGIVILLCLGFGRSGIAASEHGREN
jgi:hypothetical protein